jgi:AraC-like DNA-binding protein
MEFSGASDRDRFSLWDEFLTLHISRHDRSPTSKARFNGAMSKLSFGAFSIFNIESTPYVSRVTNAVISSKSHTENFILVVPKRGDYQISQDGFSSSLSVGDMALLDSRLTGSLGGVGQSAHSLLAVKRTIWETYAPGPRLDENFKVNPKRPAARLARAYLEEFELAGAMATPRETDTMFRHFIEMLSLYYEDSADHIPGSIHRDVRIRRIKSFVRANIADPALGISSVAEHFNISTRYVIKLFGQIDTTLMDYIWEYRLTRASALLACTASESLSVKEVGFRLGFKSPAHFSSRFSRRFGVSPSEFRRLNKNDRQIP